MAARQHSTKTSANTIVNLSRFFSMIDEPLALEYIEAAIISDTPVPLPECIKIKTTRPIPEINHKISSAITKGLKIKLLDTINQNKLDKLE